MGNITTLTKGLSHVTNNLQMGDRLAIAGMGSMKIEIPTMKDYLVKASSPNNT